MSDEIEALGGLATASLAAHELDRPSARRARARAAAAKEGLFGPKGARAAPHHAPGICANCATALTGDYCHACGQSAHVHRSIGHVVEEFAHGIWHFDSKAWRTLPLLVFRPGKLTHDYIHGKRARYIAPLALFLLSVFLMFFVFGFVGAPDLGNPDGTPPAQEAIDDIKREVANSERDLARARERGDADEIREAVQELAANRFALSVSTAGARKAASAKGAPAKPEPSWKDELATAARAGTLDINTGIPGADANIRKALENPDFAIYRVQQKAYKLSFLLVPMSLPLLWLLFFWRRDVTIYDHTVFTLYSLSFMSLLFIAIALLFKMSGLGPVFASIGGTLLLAPPVHMFFQLRGAYRLSWGGALIRTSVLAIGSTVIFSLFLALIVVLGLAD